MLPWTVFDAAGRIVGMTTYMNVDAAFTGASRSAAPGTRRCACSARR
jgi:hypothetical protein